FALFTSFIAIPRTVANASTGFIVEAVGWTLFFVICVIAAIPGMLLLLKVAPWTERTRGNSEEIEKKERAETAKATSSLRSQLSPNSPSDNSRRSGTSSGDHSRR